MVASRARRRRPRGVVMPPMDRNRMIDALFAGCAHLGA
jgi:hypothetical protein